MKKITLLLIVITFFACNNKTPEYDNTVIPQTKDSVGLVNKEPYQVEITGQITIDQELKKKVLEAFELLKKYSEETKTMPKNASDKVINCWPRIVFGKSKSVSGTIEFQVEQEATFSDLLIFFEDIPLSTANHCGETSYLDGVNRGGC